MKIAILVDEIAPGSAPKLIGQPIRALQALGHTAEALVIVDNQSHRRYSQIYDFHLKDVRIRYLYGLAPAGIRKMDFKFPGFSFFSLHHILSFFIAPLVIKSREYDLVIGHCQYSAFAGWGLRLFRAIPYLLLVWDPSTYTLRKIYIKTKLRFIYPLLYCFAYLLDFFSICGAKALITSGSLHHKRFRRICNKPLEDLYPGCFVKNDFVPYALRKKAILAYDRWDIGNKPNIFGEILKALPESVTLIIAGFWHPSSLRDDFVKVIAAAGLSQRVQLLGPLDEQAILDLCSGVMLHLHPNEEAFGMQTLEAAACGCCIIIPRGSGVTDLFKHGEDGFFYAKDNLNELISYTRNIFADIAGAERMGKSAWRKAASYSWAAHGKRLAEIAVKYANVSL